MSGPRYLLLLLSLSAPALAQLNEDVKLVASDGDVLDAFGLSIGVSGSRAVVGALYDDDNGTDSGSAYLFDVGTGQELHKLLPSDGAAGDEFGFAVAISGDRVVVGAYRDDDNGSASGSAYVFDAATGQQLWKLLPSDGIASDAFGISVDVDGDLAVVGSNWDDDHGSQSGSAYVFDLTTGQQVRKLVPADGAAGDRFGQAVAISGTVAVIGAEGDDDNGLGSGSAYLFDVTTGAQLHKLVPGDGSTDDQFGNAVDISGGRAIVGAELDDVTGNSSGSAYLFDVATGAETAKLVPADGAGGDRFGWDVAIEGDLAVIGSFMDDDGATDAGSAYLFEVVSGVQVEKFLASDAAADDFLGSAVEIDGLHVVVGAMADDDQGPASGSAYVFGLPGGCGVTYCGAGQNPKNAAKIAIDTCDSASSSILLTLSSAPPGQFAYLIVGDGDTAVSQPPGAEGDLCVAGGACLGRYDKDIGAISAGGTFVTDIQNALSDPCSGAVVLVPGVTWNFQFWHRQAGAPSTFSEAIDVTFH